ncbi:MAG: penicillin-binding transpeptidase domain-containing protein, partial [Clostridia bacterium]|nr:penicillin-binding transpeptidase domain-containing protein [Clostridia bacterium]
MLLFFVLLLSFLLYRIGFIQFVKGDSYRKMAYSNQTSQRGINPKRGSIYDRNGQGLAISAPVDSVSVNPIGLRKEFKDDEAKLQELADFLASKTEMSASDIMAIFKEDNTFESIKRKIDPKIGGDIRSYVRGKGIANLYVDEDSKRFYPKGSLASHVLGFTGIDDQGLSGIELTYDNTLKGTPGKIMNEVDVLGRPITYDPERQVDAVDGYDVTLTIDATIQYMVEEALKRAIEEDEVKMGAAAIVMDPNSGEILALASYPDFDPNRPDAKPPTVDEADWKGFKDSKDTQTLYQTVFRNKAIMDTYEPGSTFKAITAAAALEEGVVKPSSQYVDKPLEMSGWTINCWQKWGHGPEDFAHSVYNSCNPVFAQVALSLGANRFYQYARMFGFMSRTGIELAGEPTNEEYLNLWHKNPQDIDIAVAGFGQRFQVSPIQVATAYCAIANGGSLIKPTLVKQISDSNGNIIKKNEPEVERKVISKATSDELRSILEGVVSEGTGKNAYINGFRIAGKTGTSETLQTKTEGRYVVSFAAMAPANKPKIVVLVILDDPQVEKRLRSGGVLAAPIAGKLSEEILEYMQVERQYDAPGKGQAPREVITPDVSGLTVKEAGERLKAFGLTYTLEGVDKDETTTVYSQNPKA